MKNDAGNPSKIYCASVWLNQSHVTPESCMAVITFVTVVQLQLWHKLPCSCSRPHADSAGVKVSDIFPKVLNWLLDRIRPSFATQPWAVPLHNGALCCSANASIVFSTERKCSFFLCRYHSFSARDNGCLLGSFASGSAIVQCYLHDIGASPFRWYHFRQCKYAF